MNKPQQGPLSDQLDRAARGDAGAQQQLTDTVYAKLKQLAGVYLARENPGHTLQPTALVHEAFLKLLGQHSVNWKSKAHFLAIGARAMRRILVDHARAKKSQKRGGKKPRIDLQTVSTLDRGLNSDVLAVEDALQELAALDPRQAAIVELRFFGGLTMDEVSGELDIPKRTLEREWTMIRAWLRKRLHEDPTA